MESNGVCNRIHVSQATADLLIRANKGRWLIPREDKVFAKGKGYMQTYFVTVEGSGSAVSSDPRKSLVFSEAQANALLEEAIDVFDKISRRHISTRNLGHDSVSQSDLPCLDDADESSRLDEKGVSPLQEEESPRSLRSLRLCPVEEFDDNVEDVTSDSNVL